MNIKIMMAMAFVVAAWGLTATVETLSLRSLSPLAFTFYSTLFGMCGAFILTLIAGKGVGGPARNIVYYRRCFLLSMLGFAGYFLLKYTAFILSPVPQANVIQYSFTIFIVLLAKPFLGQRLGIVKMFGAITGFAGVAIVMSDAGAADGFSPAYIPGYLAALSAGLAFAFFSVLNEKWRMNSLHSLIFYHGFTAAALGLILVITRGIPIPESPVELLGAAFSGCVSNVLGMYLWLYSQSRANDVSILTGMLYFVPFVSLLFLKFILGLTIPASTAAGLVLIVGGMLIQALRSQRKLQ